MGTRRPLETPAAANQRWSLDFVSDQFTDGRRFRILAVVDDCTREPQCGETCLARFGLMGWTAPVSGVDAP